MSFARRAEDGVAWPPSVSVVVPCYACAETIERAVHSVFLQTVLPAQLVLIDDASPDSGRTLAALHDLERSAPPGLQVDVHRLTVNAGPAAARNTGWDMASNDYLAFLDADDAWHPRKLEVQSKIMVARPELALTGHNTFVARPDQTFAPLPTEWGFRRVHPLRLVLANAFPTRSVMLRRELPFRFEVAKRFSEDYHLWLRIVLSGHPAGRIPLPLACSYKADFGAGGLSGRLWDMEAGELDTYRRLCHEGRLPAWSFPPLAVYSLAKYGVRRVRSLLT